MFKNIFYFQRQSNFSNDCPFNLLRWIPLFLLLLGGCQIFPKLPPVDLNSRGWTVKEGQAIWRSKKDAPEIAGEILLATNLDGRTFLQFTKTPLPFLTCETVSNAWQVHAIPINKTYSGYGNPPVRVIWLWLPKCLAGQTPPERLAWQRRPDDGWRLENLKSGEYLDGYLSP